MVLELAKRVEYDKETQIVDARNENFSKALVKYSLHRAKVPHAHLKSLSPPLSPIPEGSPEKSPVRGAKRSNSPGFFPMSDLCLTPAQKSDLASLMQRRKQNKILLVADENFTNIQKFTNLLLELLGCAPLTPKKLHEVRTRWFCNALVYIEEKNHIIILVSNGYVAFEIFNHDTITAMITAQKLQGAMSGVDLITKIREQEVERSVQQPVSLALQTEAANEWGPILQRANAMYIERGIWRQTCEFLYKALPFEGQDSDRPESTNSF